MKAGSQLSFVGSCILTVSFNKLGMTGHTNMITFDPE